MAEGRDGPPGPAGMAGWMTNCRNALTKHWRTPATGPGRRITEHTGGCFEVGDGMLSANDNI